MHERANGYGGTAFTGGLAFNPVLGNLTLATSPNSAALGGAVSMVDRFLIDKNGNVGIGTTTPGAKLSFGSFSNATPAPSHIRLYENSTDVYGFGVSGARLNYNSGGGSHVFSNGALGSETERFRVDISGNVGVGVSAPTYQLQLSTDSAAKPGTSTWTIASDERLKDIRAPFTRGLADLEKLHTIYFRYKAHNPLDLPSEKEYVGIRAQDAEKAIPESVSRDEKGYLHVTNDAIIWTVVNSVKELAAKLMGADARIAALEAENAKLRAADAAKERRLASIEAKAKESEAAFEKRLKALEAAAKAKH
ncbi:MAG: hypothetical protein EOP11_15395 [Proteobacteria bacterium]|nr:MAG: hypothetical protein EOP11_15395 [Pseudomonadota bacterium]